VEPAVSHLRLLHPLRVVPQVSDIEASGSIAGTVAVGSGSYAGFSNFDSAHKQTKKPTAKSGEAHAVPPRVNGCKA
jgi:hypothetical protein